MHQTGVSRDDRCHFDGELVAGRVKIVVAEVEVTDARVPIESIDEVPRALERDTAMRDIHHSQSEALDHEQG